MDKQTLLAQAREWISEAEPGKALDLVEDFLKKDKRYKLLYREAVHLSAQFKKTERDESNGVISFDNAKLSYNQVNNGLLNLLEYLENDELRPPALTARPAGWKAVYQSNRLLFLLGLPVLVLSVVVLILVFQPDKNGENGPVADLQFDKNCSVTFADSTLNILLLPFFRPAGDPIQVEGLIIERLEDVSATLRLNTDVELCLPFKPVSLLNFEDAASIGKGNRAGMVIWGRAEKGPAFNVIKTRYKYLGGSDTLQFARLKWQGEKQVSSDKVLSIITSEGELTEDIEATVMLALGLYADQAGKKEAALIAFERARVQDSSAILIKNMMLADAYLASEQPEKALASLDTLLDTHPNYWLGLNNRAVLRMQSEDYLGAIEDLSVALEKRPADADMLLARGTAYERSDQLYPAREDFQKVIEKNPERAPDVKDKLENTNQRIKNLEEVVRKTTTKPARNITQREYIAAADASRQLGDPAETKRLVSKGLELSPDNPKLLAIQLENLLKEKKDDEARKVLSEALRRGVAKDQIARHSRIVSAFLEK